MQATNARCFSRCRATEEHQKVVDQLQAAGLENVWLVGEEFKDIPCSYRKFQNVEEVKEALKANQAFINWYQEVTETSS